MLIVAAYVTVRVGVEGYVEEEEAAQGQRKVNTKKKK